MSYTPVMFLSILPEILLLVLGLLLASADGVFASFFDVPVPDVGSPLLHLASGFSRIRYSVKSSLWVTSSAVS